MIKKLLSSERGYADHGWLKSYHSFSFANYFNPEYMGFKSLRVLNEDFIAPTGGFPTHSHKNMEIITIVYSGALEHKDSLGNQSIIKPGEVQKMSAGSGIQHSEFNPSNNEETHLTQIWITPNRMVETSYQQIDFSKLINTQALTLVCSPEGENGSITIAQNAKLFFGQLNVGSDHTFKALTGHDQWLQLISGEINVSNQHLQPGDALAITKEEQITIQAKSKSQFLLFDLY